MELKLLDMLEGLAIEVVRSIEEWLEETTGSILLAVS
jgi:hypothetical protein